MCFGHLLVDIEFLLSQNAQEEVRRELPVDKDLCVNCVGDGNPLLNNCLIYLPFNFHFFSFLSMRQLLFCIFKLSKLYFLPHFQIQILF